MEHTQAIQLKAAERYVLGELPRDLREQYEEHFFSCVECAEEVNLAAAFVENSRAAMGSEPVLPPVRLPVSCGAAVGRERLVRRVLAAEFCGAGVCGAADVGGVSNIFWLFHV